MAEAEKREASLISGPGAIIPVSVLTGFLGSGKTTILNRLVRAPEMRGALVIINEFGAIGLDHELVTRSNDDLVVEMMGGCLCCTIRGDLANTLREAPLRFMKEGRCAFDRVMIETTGLADPIPILHTLMLDPGLAGLYALDGVLATVDAATGMGTLDTQEESVRQAAVADRILLTKTDLVSSDEREALAARLAALNPGAPVFPVVNGEVDPALLFGCGLYDPHAKTDDVQRWLNAEAFDPGHHHHHHGDAHHHDVNRHDARIQATCLTFEEPLQGEAFARWIDVLTMFKGPDILRMKGILNLADRDRPVVIHGVQHVFHPPVELEGWPSEDRRSRMVFITRGITADDLRGTLALMTIGLDKFGLEGLVSDGLGNAAGIGTPA